MVAALIAADPKGFLSSLAIFLLGVLAMFSPVLQFRGKTKPWRDREGS
jgi:hypothetical protein